MNMFKKIVYYYLLSSAILKMITIISSIIFNGGDFGLLVGYDMFFIFPTILISYFILNHFYKSVKDVNNLKKKINKIILFNIILTITIFLVSKGLSKYIVVKVNDESSLTKEISLIGKHSFNINNLRDSVITLKKIEEKSKTVIFNTKSDHNYKLFVRVKYGDQQKDHYVASISRNNVRFRILKIDITDDKEVRISNNGLYN